MANVTQQLDQSEKTAVSTDRATSRVVTLLPQGHFLENMSPREGLLYVTDYYGQSIYTFEPEKGMRLHAKMRTSPLDISFDVDGVGVVTAHDESAKAGPAFMSTNAVWLLHPDGHSERLIAAPDAKFLNGIVRLSAGVFLAADSYTGLIWRIDRAAAEITVHKRDPLFKRTDENSFDPALNGLKLYRGYLYASNTTTAQILRMRLEGEELGDVEVVANQLRCDDFIFGKSGSLYAAGQGDTVTRLDADGTQTVIATADDRVLGATAACFGVTERDRNHFI